MSTAHLDQLQQEEGPQEPTGPDGCIGNASDEALMHVLKQASDLFVKSLSRDFELVRADIACVARLAAVQHSEEEDDSEEIAMLRGEIGRLKREINTHREGVLGATKAGLDALGERARQRRMEGYDDAHDDRHEDFALSSAAIAYLMDARLRGTTGHGFTESPPPDWPWEITDWKTKNIRQALVVAAALVIAEIERLDRAGVNG